MSLTNFTLEKFTGPLDLLLTLLDQKKLSITEVALSDVTEQYLAYLDTLDDERVEELADFLVIASKLLLLKAKMLLPHFLPEEEEAVSTLEAQLRIYKAFVEVSKAVQTYWRNDKRFFFRLEPPHHSEEFKPPTNVTLFELEDMMQKVVFRLRPPKPLPETKIDRTVSLKEKIDAIRRLITRGKSIGFRALLADVANKTEIIVSFLAILELMKQGQVTVRQKESFHDIMIEPV